MDAKIAIVGAGISGLAAAYELKNKGLKPVVFEKESFVGGRMSSETVDGFVIDKAAYTFPEFHVNLTRLLDRLGMRETLLLTPGTSSTFAGGKEYQIKIGSPSDFLRYRLLSLKAKKDMVKLFLYAQWLGKALNLIEPTDETFELEKESAADYVLKNYGEEILEHIAYPIFCEIFLGEPETNSKAAFLATIKNLMRFKIFSFVHGMGMLPERLRNQLDVKLETPVKKVSRTSHGCFEVHVGSDHPESIKFDAVILAVPATTVPDVLEGLPSSFDSGLRGICYSPSIVVALALDASYPDMALISNMSRRDYRTIGTLVCDRLKGGQRVPAGKELVTAILSEQASRKFLDRSDEELLAGVLTEADKVLPGLANKLMFSRAYRWEHGAVQLPPGMLARQHALRRALEEEFDDLYIASDGLYKSSLEVSFLTGVRAAHHVARRFIDSSDSETPY
ncbi:MAG: FAD-dependent oxidoreductase [Thermodesulfobacteriota bacterium]